MTATTSDTCEEVVLASDYFDSNNLSVSLLVKYNCDVEYEIEIDVDNTEITVTPTLLELTDEVLADGIYYFELTITQSNSAVITESICKFVNCSYTCSMLDVFKDLEDNEENIIRALSFYALTLSEGCTSCQCTDLCTIYNNTLEEDCEDVKPCGCT